MKTMYAFIFAGLAVTSCKSPDNQKKQQLVVEQSNQTVLKPIEGLEIAPRIFTVSGQEASRIDLPNGGSIEFPANAFVDEKGNPVQGNVQIKWREYHSLTDLMFSGIPMKYDSLGKEYDFISGGMFDISASANNQKVNLAKGKNAAVNLASIDDTPCYNFYQLDEKTGVWDYKTTKLGTPLPEKKVEKTQVKEQANKDFIIDAQADLSACPELKTQPIVGWRALEKISPSDEQLLVNAKSECTLKPGENAGEYQLEVKMAKSSRNYRVKPYLISEAKQDTRKNEITQEKDYQQILMFQQNLYAGKVIRSIEIPGFGIYNWDCMAGRANTINIQAKFSLPHNLNDDLASVFYISPDEKLVVRYGANYGSTFCFDPRKKNLIVAILPDNSVVYAGKDEFLNAAREGKSYNFKLRKTEFILESGKDMEKIIRKLI